ncbi:hypothetical protein OPQ81_007315 [Rhizoctonia solani]|nr:hypothetical protein OPQ81_007315 [Rhizoctonia solani]
MPTALNNPLASLSPDQLSAVFQTMSTFYNLITAPSLASNDPCAHRSHRAAALAAAASTLPKLKEGAYPQWAFAVGDAIRSAGLWDYVSGDVTSPADKTSKEYDLYLQESGIVRAVIVGALDPDKSFRYLGGTTTPKEAWDILRLRYHDSDDAALRAIDEQLMGLRLEEGGNLIEHIALFKKLKRELDGSDFEVNPTRAVQWMWRSLPSSYDHVILRQQRSKVRDFDQICLELETHYRSQVSSSSPTATDYTAHTSLPKPACDWNVPEDLRGLRLTGAKNPALATRASDTCWDCLETGHRADTPQCNFHRYRIELWGPDVPNPNRTSHQPAEQPAEHQANVTRAKPTIEPNITELPGPSSRPESPVPEINALDSSTSSPSIPSSPLPILHSGPQLHQPADLSPTTPSFCSIPEIDLGSNLTSPVPIPASPPPIRTSSSPTEASPSPTPALPPVPLPASPIYGTQPTRPVTPDELRTAVQDLVSAIHGGDPVDLPPDWLGPPKCLPRTPTSEIPGTPDSQVHCIFEEFTASEPLVFKDPQGTPGGTRMVNGALLSALSLGRHSFTPWEENYLEDLMESLDASEEASPGGLGRMYEVLFPGGFFDLDAALPFSREIVDLFFAWYHAVRIHNGLKMEPKRVCKCGAVTR